MCNFNRTEWKLQYSVAHCTYTVYRLVRPSVGDDDKDITGLSHDVADKADLGTRSSFDMEEQ